MTLYSAHSSICSVPIDIFCLTFEGVLSEFSAGFFYWVLFEFLIYIFTLVKCATVSNGEIEFCNCNTCSENEGDCDTHYECLDGLSCGSNNCLDSLGFDSEIDCCYKPTVGDEHFCSTDKPCAIDEGNCNSKNECQKNLICDTINSCPIHLGFSSDVNCCSNSTGCKFYKIISYYCIVSILMLRFCLH